MFDFLGTLRRVAGMTGGAQRRRAHKVRDFLREATDREVLEAIADVTDEEVQRAIRSVPAHHATTPAFASTFRCHVKQFLPADGSGTQLDFPVVFTGAVKGTRITSARVVSGSTAPSACSWIPCTNDGTRKVNFDSIAVAANTNTVQSAPVYSDVKIPDNTWTVMSMLTVTLPTSASVHATVFGEDIT